MKHTMRIRWSDLGSPTEPGHYFYGEHTVRVRRGDIELANGNPNAVFTAIREIYHANEEPYKLTRIEFPAED